MTLRHFEILKAVEEAGNFTKAAKHLYITQSAVSHAIKELEDETGAQLFERAPGGIQITKQGSLLLEQAKPVLYAFEDLKKQAHELEKQLPLQIVSSITIAAFRLPKTLKKFGERWPEIQIEVEVVSARTALERLKEGKADLAFIEGSRPQGSFSCLEFGSYSMAVVCSPEYGRDFREEITPRQLCQEKLLLREKGSAVRDALDSALYLSGYEAKPVWQSVNSGALAAAAKEGLGIAVLPRQLIEKELRTGQLREVNVKGLVLKNQMLAVWPADQHLSEPVRNLLEFVKTLI